MELAATIVAGAVFGLVALLALPGGPFIVGVVELVGAVLAWRARRPGIAVALLAFAVVMLVFGLVVLDRSVVEMRFTDG